MSSSCGINSTDPPVYRGDKYLHYTVSKTTSIQSCNSMCSDIAASKIDWLLNFISKNELALEIQSSDLTQNSSI